jgi:hypothetical protein
MFSNDAAVEVGVHSTPKYIYYASYSSYAQLSALKAIKRVNTVVYSLANEAKESFLGLPHYQWGAKFVGRKFFLAGNPDIGGEFLQRSQPRF